MDKFIDEFDPLVALETEYAAVVARTRDDPACDGTNDSDDQTDEKRAPEPAEESDNDAHQDEEEDLFDGAELYVPLAADSDEEYDDDHSEEQQETQQPVLSLGTAPAPPAPLDESTKQSIMAAMQSLQLKPPSWARDANIPDDELVELVQRRLQRSAAPPQANQ